MNRLLLFSCLCAMIIHIQLLFPLRKWIKGFLFTTLYIVTWIHMKNISVSLELLVGHLCCWFQIGGGLLTRRGAPWLHVLKTALCGSAFAVSVWTFLSIVGPQPLGRASSLCWFSGELYFRWHTSSPVKWEAWAEWLLGLLPAPRSAASINPGCAIREWKSKWQPWKGPGVRGRICLVRGWPSCGHFHVRVKGPQSKGDLVWVLQVGSVATWFKF